MKIKALAQDALALHIAIVDDKVSEVYGMLQTFDFSEILLTQIMHPGGASEGYMNPLETAINKGKPLMVKILLENPARHTSIEEFAQLRYVEKTSNPEVKLIVEEYITHVTAGKNAIVESTIGVTTGSEVFILGSGADYDYVVSDQE